MSIPLEERKTRIGSFNLPKLGTAVADRRGRVFRVLEPPFFDDQCFWIGTWLEPHPFLIIARPPPFAQCDKSSQLYGYDETKKLYEKIIEEYMSVNEKKKPMIFKIKIRERSIFSLQ